jgi:glycerophosphoryl diester phosphodiesterase
MHLIYCIGSTLIFSPVEIRFKSIYTRTISPYNSTPAALSVILSSRLNLTEKHILIFILFAVLFAIRVTLSILLHMNTLSKSLHSFPRIIAHRGGAQLWPENSLIAARESFRLGVSAIEIDVHLTKDGVPFVFHDHTLDRCTVESGLISDLHSHDLHDVFLKNLDGSTSSEHIPTLAELCHELRHCTGLLSIELKNRADHSPYDDINKKVLNVLNDTPKLPLLAHSFDWNLIAAFKQETRLIPVAANIHAQQFMQHHASLLALRDQLYPLSIFHFNMYAAILDATPNWHHFFREQQHAGFQALASIWTVNDEDALRSTLTMPLFGIATDRPDLALHIRKEYENAHNT